MSNFVKIKFNDKKESICHKQEFNLKKNITVIVETKNGLQFGTVIDFIDEINDKYAEDDKIIRIANKKDYLKNISNIEEEKKAIKKCKELSLKHDLNIQVLDAQFTFDREQLVFRFISDTRIDFRELAKDLAKCYHTRIELRQIGIRDKAREVSGLGPCGRKLCCSSFLKDLNSVSINMAKNQNISLNPTKINGCCGRLLCCLNYEDETYKACRAKLPNIGDKVKVKDKLGTVVALDILNGEYSVELSKNEIVKETIK